jgi:hypothetical protein
MMGKFSLVSGYLDERFVIFISPPQQTLEL